MSASENRRFASFTDEELRLIDAGLGRLNVEDVPDEAVSGRLYEEIEDEMIRRKDGVA